MDEAADKVSRRFSKVGSKSEKPSGKSNSPVPGCAPRWAATEEDKKERHPWPAGRSSAAEAAQPGRGSSAKPRRHKVAAAASSGGSRAAHHRNSAVATGAAPASQRGPRDARPGGDTSDQRQRPGTKATECSALVAGSTGSGFGNASDWSGSHAGLGSTQASTAVTNTAKADDPLLVVHVDVSEDNLDCDLDVRGGSSDLPDGGSSDSRPPPSRQPRVDLQLVAAAQPAVAVAAATTVASDGSRDPTGRTSGAVPRIGEPRAKSPRRPATAKALLRQSHKRKGKGKRKCKPGSADTRIHQRLRRADQGSVNRLVAAATKHRSVWVSGLSISTKVADLRTLFGKCGKVMSASVVKKEDDRSLTFHGVVTMATSEEAERCQSQLNGTQYRGRLLEVLPHSSQATRCLSAGPACRIPDTGPQGINIANKEELPTVPLVRAGSADGSRTTKPVLTDAHVLTETAAAVAVVKSSSDLVQQHDDPSESNCRILHLLQRIAADTQRLKEAQDKLAADKEALRLDKRLLEATERELGDVCRQRLRLERDIKDLQEKCQRERSDLHRLKDLRAKELSLLSNGMTKESDRFDASTSSSFIPTSAVTSRIIAAVNDSSIQGIANTAFAPEPMLADASTLGTTSRMHNIPSLANQSFGADQLLCIGGALYRVGGGDGNVLVLSRLAVDVQPLVYAGATPLGGQLSGYGIQDTGAAFSRVADSTSTTGLPIGTNTDQQGLARSPLTASEPARATTTVGIDNTIENNGSKCLTVPGTS